MVVESVRLGSRLLATIFTRRPLNSIEVALVGSGWSMGLVGTVKGIVHHNPASLFAFIGMLNQLITPRSACKS